eukprot:11159904-Alexandrium_andersonii.AAC.1
MCAAGAEHDEERRNRGCKSNTPDKRHTRSSKPRAERPKCAPRERSTMRSARAGLRMQLRVQHTRRQRPKAAYT